MAPSTAARKLQNALRHAQQAQQADAQDSDSGDSFLDDDEGDADHQGPDSDDDGAEINEFGMLKSSDDSSVIGDQNSDYDEDGTAELQEGNGAHDIDEDNEDEPADDIYDDSNASSEVDAEEADDDDDDDGAIATLRDAITSATTARAAEEAANKVKKRKIPGFTIPQYEYADEDEATTPKKKLTLDDIRQHTSSTFGTRALQSLDHLEKKAKTKSEVVKARLGRRLESRIDRAAAYAVATDNITRWEDTVKQNRQATHLEFPLQKEDTADATAGVTGTLDEDEEISREKLLNELGSNEATVEDVAKRREALRKARDQMFREEMKARRLKKIKSKTYHKIHKRERERAKELAGQLDGSDAEEDGDDDYTKMVQRARQRMDLKHKSTSKWAQDVKRMNLHKDKGTRSELEAMLRRGEELERKISGADEQESSDDDDMLLSAIDDAEASPEPVKGIAGMKFMRDAEERLRLQNEQTVEEVRRIEAGGDLRDERTTSTAYEVINDGRRKFTPGAQESYAELVDVMEQSEEQDEAPRALDKKLASIVVRSAIDSKGSAGRKEKGTNDDASESANPWIQEVDGGSVAKGGSLLYLSKDSTRTAKSQEALSRAKRNTRKHVDTTEVQIDANQILQARDIHDEGIDDSEQADETDDAQVTMTYQFNKRNAKHAVTFQQRDLVKRAFSGDDVVREFDEEKKRVIEDEGDKEIDVTLPGWGSWTGKGTRKPQRRFIEKVSGINPKQRKDSKLKNVIINEKSIKKSAKYMTDQVPYPYETREQYERALRMPIGKEWNAQTTTQKTTKPRIIVKTGVVLEPLSRPLV
ncbi:small-subunit processome [Limtongia smithiae]|uniref:small-subunit processome n=1 Tax=Limtongia smithiae TaxID=1125753 RepID=UPI0034CFE4B4